MVYNEVIDYTKLNRKNKEVEGNRYKEIFNTLFNDKILRLLSMFEWEGLPENIPQEMLELQLLLNGFTVFFKKGDDYYISPGELGVDFDYLYLPTKAIISNPYLSGGFYETLNIGENCVVIKNDPLCQGVGAKLAISNEILTHIKLSATVALINLRMVAIIKAGTEDAKREAEAFLEKLSNGDLAILGDSQVLEQISINPYIQPSYVNVLKTLLEYEQYVGSREINDFGLNANWNAKREAIGEGESSLNDDSLKPLVDTFRKSREKAAEQIKELYGLELIPKLSSAWADNEIQVEAELEQIQNEADGAGEPEGDPEPEPEDKKGEGEDENKNED